MFDSEVLASRMYAVCVAVARLMHITLLFLLFSIPLITMGASLTALIATIRQPEFIVFKTFWKVFKENFFRSCIVMIFTVFTLMFLGQARAFTVGLPAGNIIYFFILSFLVVYNLNAYLLVSMLKKSNLTFFRQVFFFTIGTFYKGFFIPLITAGLAIILPIIGGIPLLLMSLSIALSIYIKMIRNDLEVIKEYL